MTIFVQTPVTTDKLIELHVEEATTILQIKAMLQAQKGIPIEQQRLEAKPLNKGINRLLQNERSLRQYQIVKDDVLQLGSARPAPVLGSAPSSASMAFLVSIRESDALHNNLKSDFLLQVSPMDTIDQVKEKIEKQQGFPKEAHNLSDGSDKIMAGEATLQQRLLIFPRQWNLVVSQVAKTDAAASVQHFSGGGDLDAGYQVRGTTPFVLDALHQAPGCGIPVPDSDISSADSDPAFTSMLTLAEADREFAAELEIDV